MLPSILQQRLSTPSTEAGALETLRYRRAPQGISSTAFTTKRQSPSYSFLGSSSSTKVEWSEAQLDRLELYRLGRPCKSGEEPSDPGVVRSFFRHYLIQDIATQTPFALLTKRRQTLRGRLADAHHSRRHPNRLQFHGQSSRDSTSTCRSRSKSAALSGIQTKIEKCHRREYLNQLFTAREEEFFPGGRNRHFFLSSTSSLCSASHRSRFLPQGAILGVRPPDQWSLCAILNGKVAFHSTSEISRRYSRRSSCDDHLGSSSKKSRVIHVDLESRRGAEATRRFLLENLQYSKRAQTSQGRRRRVEETAEIGEFRHLSERRVIGGDTSSSNIGAKARCTDAVKHDGRGKENRKQREVSEPTHSAGSPSHSSRHSEYETSAQHSAKTSMEDSSATARARTRSPIVRSPSSDRLNPSTREACVTDETQAVVAPCTHHARLQKRGDESTPSTTDCCTGQNRGGKRFLEEISSASQERGLLDSDWCDIKEREKVKAGSKTGREDQNHDVWSTSEISQHPSKSGERRGELTAAVGEKDFVEKIHPCIPLTESLTGGDTRHDDDRSVGSQGSHCLRRKKETGEVQKKKQVEEKGEEDALVREVAQIFKRSLRQLLIPLHETGNLSPSLHSSLLHSTSNRMKSLSSFSSTTSSNNDCSSTFLHSPLSAIGDDTESPDNIEEFSFSPKRGPHKGKLLQSLLERSSFPLLFAFICKSQQLHAEGLLQLLRLSHKRRLRSIAAVPPPNRPHALRPGERRLLRLKRELEEQKMKLRGSRNHCEEAPLGRKGLLNSFLSHRVPPFFTKQLEEVLLEATKKFTLVDVQLFLAACCTQARLRTVRHTLSTLGVCTPGHLSRDMYDPNHPRDVSSADKISSFPRNTAFASQQVVNQDVLIPSLLKQRTSSSSSSPEGETNSLFSSFSPTSSSCRLPSSLWPNSSGLSPHLSGHVWLLDTLLSSAVLTGVFTITRRRLYELNRERSKHQSSLSSTLQEVSRVSGGWLNTCHSIRTDECSIPDKGRDVTQGRASEKLSDTMSPEENSRSILSSSMYEKESDATRRASIDAYNDSEEDKHMQNQQICVTSLSLPASSSSTSIPLSFSDGHHIDPVSLSTLSRQFASILPHSPPESSSGYLFHQQQLRANQQWRQEWRRDMKTVERLLVHFSSLSALLCQSSSSPSRLHTPFSLAPTAEVEHIPAGYQQSDTSPKGGEAAIAPSLTCMQQSLCTLRRDEVNDPVFSETPLSDSNFVKLSITFLRILLRLLQTPVSVTGGPETGQPSSSCHLINDRTSLLNCSRLFDSSLGSSSSLSSTGGTHACQVNNDELGNSPSPLSPPTFFPFCLVHPSSLARMILVCTSPPILSSISLDSLTTVLREDVKETKSLDTLLSNVYQALHVQLAQQPDKLRTEDLVDLLERLEERLVHTPHTPSFLAVVHNEIKPQAICGEGGSKSKLSSSLSSSLVSPKSFSFSPSSSLSSDKKRDAFVNSENASILPNRLVTPQSPLLSSAKGTPNSYCFRDGMGDTEGDRSSDEKSSPRDKQENDGNLMTTWGPSKEDKLRAMMEFLLFEVLPSRMDTLSVHLNQRCIDIAKKLQTKFSHHPIASSSANVANEETTTKMKNLEKLLSKLVDSAHHTTTDPRNVTVPFYQPHVSTDRSNFPSEREVVDLEQSENHEESGESSKEMPVKIQDGRRNTTLLPESRRQQVVRQGPQADLMGQREEIVRGLKSAMVVVPETPLGEDKEKRSDGNFITTSHHVGRKRRDFRPKMKKNRHEEENKEEISRCSEGEQHEKPHMNTVSLIHTKERFSSDLLPSSNLILLNLAASHHPSSRRLNLQAPANMEYHLQSYSCSPLSSPSIRCLLSLFVGNDMKKQTIERDQARSTMRATAFLYVRCRRYKKRLQAPLDLLSGLSKLLIKRYEHERQERYHMIRNRLVYTEAEAKGRREEVLLSESPSQVQDMTDVRPLSAQQLTSSLQDSFVLLENEESRKEIRRNALHSSSHEEKNKREQDSHLLPSLLQLEDDKLFPQSEQVSLSPVPLCDLFLHLQKRGEMKKNRKRNLLVNDRLVLDKLSRDEKQGKQPISYSPHDMDPQKTSSSCSSSFSSSSQKDYGAASPLKPSEEEDEEDVQQEREHRQRRGASVSQRMTAEREESLAMNHFIRDQEIRDRDEEERQNSIPDILEKKTCVRSADDIEMKLGEGMNEHILPSYVGPMNIVQELQRLLCLPPERWKSHMASLATLKLLQVLKVCAYQYEGVVSFLEKHQDQLILPPLSSLVVAQEKKEKHRKHSIESPRRTVDLGRRDISASKKEKESSSSSLSLKGSLVPNVDTTAEVSRTRPLDGFNEEGDRVYGAVLAQAILPWGRLDAFLMCLLDVLTSQLHRKYNKSGEDGGVFHRVAASLMEDDRGNKERATAVMRGSPEGMARGNLERLEETEDRDELRGLQSPRGQRQLRSTLRLVTPRDVSLGASILRALAVLQQSHKKFYQGYMERKDFAGSRSSEKDGWIAQEDRERKTPEVGEGVIDEIVFDKEEENRGEEREDMMTRGTDDGRRKTVIDERGEKKKDSGGRRIRVEMKKAYQTRMREEEMARGRSKDDRGMGVLLKSIIHQCAEEVLELLLPSHRLWKLSLLQFVQVVYATEVLFLLSPSSTMKGSFTSLSQSSFPQMDSPSLTGISPSSSLCRTSMLSASIRPDQEKTREDSTPLTDTRGDKLSETGTEHLSSYSTQQASLSPTPSTLTWGKVPMASPFEPCLSYNRREDQPKTLTWGSHSRLLSDLSPSVKRHLFALVAVTESLLHPLPGMKRVNGHRGDRESSSCTFQVSKDQQEGMLCKEPEKQETELGEEHNIQSSVMTMDERCGTAIETSSKAQESTSGAERVETKRKMIKEKKATSKIEGLISFSSLHHSPRRTPLPFTAIAPLTRSFTAMYRHVYLSVEQLRIERKDREPLAKRNAEKKTLRTCEQDHQEEGRELAEGITVDEAATLQRGQDSIRLKTVATAKPSLDEPYIRRRRSFDDRREKEEREIVDKSLRDGEALLEEYEKVLLRLAAEAVCVSHRLSEKHWRTIVRSLLSTVSSSSFLPFFFFSLPLRLRTTEANNERAFSSWSSCHLDNRRDGYHARLSCFSPESSVLNDTLCNTSKRVSPRLSKDLQFLLGYLKRCSHDPRSSTSFSPLKGACTIPAGRTSIDRTRSSLTPSSSSFLRLSSSSSPSSRSSSIPSSPFSAIHPVARFLKETVMLYEEEKRRKSLFLHRASRSSSHADPSPPSMNLSTSSLSYLPAKFSPQMSLDGKEARGRRKQSGERKRLFLTPRSKGGSQQEESLHPVRGVGLYEKNKEISDTEAKGKEKNGEVEESLGRRKKKMKSLFQGYHTEGGSGCSSQTSEEEEERERLPRERKEELLEEDMAAELIQRFMNPMLATEEGTYLPPERVDKPPGERYSLHLYQADANLLGEKTRRGTACEEETPSGEKEMGVKNVDLATPTKGPGSERCF